MAYVGTPRWLGNARDTLASIIQGEAGGQGARGMGAVAGVIQNRAASNFSGYGNSIVDQALARNQFQGQSFPPSAQAYSIADQLISGSLTDPTGGATFYANPSASSASWARNLNSGNALQIGDHFFTDNARGVPFQPSFNQSAQMSPLAYTSDARAPGSSSDPLGIGGSATQTQEGAFSLNYIEDGGPSGGNIGPYDFGSGTNASANAEVAGIPQAPAAGSADDFSYRNLTQQQAFTNTQTVGGSITVPQAIDSQTSALNKNYSNLSQSIKQASETEAQTAKANTKSATETASTIFDRADASAKNIFVRFAVALLGLIVIGGGLYMLASKNGSLPKAIKFA